jgi:hypothetical protein
VSDFNALKLLELFGMIAYGVYCDLMTSTYPQGANTFSHFFKPAIAVGNSPGSKYCDFHGTKCRIFKVDDRTFKET